jgi:hypothetical protein
LRPNAPSAAKILFTVRSEFFNGLRNAAGYLRRFLFTQLFLDAALTAMVMAAMDIL